MVRWRIRQRFWLPPLESSLPSRMSIRSNSTPLFRANQYWLSGIPGSNPFCAPVPVCAMTGIRFFEDEQQFSPRIGVGCHLDDLTLRFSAQSYVYEAHPSRISSCRVLQEARVLSGPMHSPIVKSQKRRLKSGGWIIPRCPSRRLRKLMMIS